MLVAIGLGFRGSARPDRRLDPGVRSIQRFVRELVWRDPALPTPRCDLMLNAGVSRRKRQSGKRGVLSFTKSATRGCRSRRGGTAATAAPCGRRGLAHGARVNDRTSPNRASPAQLVHEGQPTRRPRHRRPDARTAGAGVLPWRPRPHSHPSSVTERAQRHGTQWCGALTRSLRGSGD